MAEKSSETPPVAGDGTPPVEGDDESSKTVPREKYRGLLDEKKTASAKLQAANAELETLRSEKAAREQAEAIKRGDHEALAKTAKDEADRLKTENEFLKAERTEQRKLGAFVRNLGQPLDAKFYGLVDLDKIKVGADGSIDQETLTKAVSEYKRTYAETLTIKSGGEPPGGSPKGAKGSALSVEEWRALPLKERKQRMGDVKV